MTTRHVAITGAGRGIGKAVAERFLKGGWHVWALMRDESQLDALKQHGEARFIKFDATDVGSVVAAAQKLLIETGHVHALVNNAGIAHSASLAKTSTEEFLRVQAVNVTAPFILCRELMPSMTKAGGGRVVNVGSTASKKGFKYTSAYCASKHALLGLSRALSAEFASKNVTVNTVCPGWVDTDMFKASVDRVAQTTGRSQTEARGALESMTPMGRAVKPEEVAEVVYFLCDSPAGAIITGSDYAIDGGETT